MTGPLTFFFTLMGGLQQAGISAVRQYLVPPIESNTCKDDILMKSDELRNGKQLQVLISYT